MTRNTPILRQIRTQLCGPAFEKDAEESTEMMIDWIRDLKESDPIAMWCWGVVVGLFGGEV